MPQIIYKSPPLSTTLLTACGIAVLCGLGTWQVKRLTWKEGLIAQRSNILSQPPQPLLGLLSSSLSDFLPKRVFTEGMFLNDKIVQISPRTYNGKIGAHIVVPLKINKDTTLLVNKGWVAEDHRNHFNSDKSLLPIKVMVTGILRAPDLGGTFTPPNQPQKNEWYTIDPTAIAKARNLPHLLPYVVYAQSIESNENKTKAESETLAINETDYSPLPAALLPELKNDHKQYAIFWFTMAAILLSIFILRFRPIAFKK